MSGTPGEVEDAFAFPLFGVDHNAMRVKLLAHGIGDHQREARRIHH
jgi:hypothetical protein